MTADEEKRNSLLYLRPSATSVAKKNSALKYTVMCFGLVMLLVDCSSPGTLTVREEPNQRPSLIDVPSSGRYGLFMAGDSDPIVSFTLGKLEKIGFEQSQAGVVGEMRFEMIFAVAGEHRIPLDITKTYEWRQL